MKDIKVQFAKDGFTVDKVIVGEHHYQVTLITSAEPKPVEGKWYRFIDAEKREAYTENKWYKHISSNEKHHFFGSNYGGENGWMRQSTYQFFDLSTPLDFDPETLVGKTFVWDDGGKFSVKKIEWPRLYDNDGHTCAVLDLITLINTNTIKVLDPEPTLTVPENVEFVMWGRLSLVYNGFILCGVDNGFTFADVRMDFKRITNLKLIPCKLDEVQNGEWVVDENEIDNPVLYRLKTAKGWVSIDEDYQRPIMIEAELHESDWLKVVQG